jgi:outer membrane receptor protein involved in Fe transport
LKSQLNLKKALITVLFVIIGVAVFAQTGKISGKVSDKTTGETLIGVTVKIKGTTKGSSTDVEGRYIIGTLSPGKYILEASYIGYATKNITEVEVKNGVTTVVDLIMEEGGDQRLNEVVITASVKKETVSALYAQQKSSVRVSDGISSETIKRSPDNNTGEVLKRVSGTSIQDNKFVVVRGLSDRYNSTLLNNAPLPSSEPDRKAFSFDIIPSNLIDQVIINKTAAADLPSDFSGGVIQIRTKDFPTQRVLDLNYSVSYNSISTFNDFKGGERGGLDFLGFDDGLRKLPSNFPATRREFVNLSLDKRVELTKSLANSWAVNNQGIAIPNQSAQVVFGNSYTLGDDRKFGVIASLSYRTNMNINPQRRADYFELTGENYNDFTFDYSDDVYTRSVNLGALANFAYSYKKSKIGFKNLYNRSFDDRFTERTGSTFEIPNFDQRNTQFELEQKSLINSILEGEHVFGKRNMKLDWNTSFSSSSRSQPDLRRIYYTRTLGTNEDFSAAVPQGTGSPKNAGRFFSDLQDYIYGASANLTVPFKIKNLNQVAKFGVWNNYKTRAFSTRQLGYIIPNPNNNINNLLKQSQDVIFSAANINANGFIIDDITENRDTYDASGLLNAGYVMFTSDLTSKLKMNYGLRVESYQEELISKDPTIDEVSNDYLDFLPSANLIYSLTDKTNLRLSYSNTLARAEFRELASFSFFDFETNNVIIGNPNIKRTRIDNFDFRMEYFPSSGQILSFSTFYKNFNNPIEQIFNTGSSAASKTLSFQNATSSTLYGLEVEARQKLSFLGSNEWFDKLTVYANASIIKSEVNLDRKLYPNINDSRPLQGQSPYLINGGLQYTSDTWNVNALYNKIGRRISVVGFGKFVNNTFQPDYLDIYENPRDVIDLQVSRRFAKQKAEMKLNVGDILNQKRVLYQDFNGDKKFNSKDDQTISTLTYGTNFSLSFSYKF